MLQPALLGEHSVSHQLRKVFHSKDIIQVCRFHGILEHHQIFRATHHHGPYPVCAGSLANAQLGRAFADLRARVPGVGLHPEGKVR